MGGVVEGGGLNCCWLHRLLFRAAVLRLAKALIPTSHPPIHNPMQVAELADSAHGFVAADLAALCNEAAMIALRRTVVGSSGDCPCVTLADFRAAETRTRPSAMRELAFEVPKVCWGQGSTRACRKWWGQAGQSAGWQAGSTS